MHDFWTRSVVADELEIHPPAASRLIESLPNRCFRPCPTGCARVQVEVCSMEWTRNSHLFTGHVGDTLLASCWQNRTSRKSRTITIRVADQRSS